MAIHYKKRKWYEEVDPAFNETIKKYLACFRLVHIPANEGHLILSLPKDTLKKMEREGYPKFSKFYEQEDIQKVLDDAKVLFPEELKDINVKRIKKQAKKSGMHLIDYFRFHLTIAEAINKNSHNDYYQKSLKTCESCESLKQYMSGMSEKERMKYGRKIQSDILSMTWYIGMSGIEELRKDNKHTKKLRMNISNNSKLIRRLLFSVWDTLSIINHKKPLIKLYSEARDGNNKSLFHLFQYDPTLCDHEWVRVRLRKALYSGDVKFFNELAKTLQKGCLDTGKQNLEISFALMNFWKAGIYRLTTPQKMELLKDSGIQFKQNVIAFRKIVDRIRPFVDWSPLKSTTF
jgi:hypothetical protein